MENSVPQHDPHENAIFYKIVIDSLPRCDVVKLSSMSPLGKALYIKINNCFNYNFPNGHVFFSL